MKVAIAGAFGFIGQHLIQHFLETTQHTIRAISRSPRRADVARVECVAADLYSLKQTKEALSDCDIAIYLVHSMAPSSRLSQGKFQDFDFILADNFARAAVACKIKSIIYVGGMIPEQDVLSPHLKSRLEVEEILRSYGTPVTTFRCGIVIGHKASSFSIIVRLTERLPVMVLPQWMRTRSNPIYVGDLVRLVATAIADPSKEHRIIDAGMDQSVSYKDIVIATAKFLAKSPNLIDVPYVSPHLSKLWVRLVSGAPKALVYPLIDSVRHEMLMSAAHPIPETWGIEPCGLDEAVSRTFKLPFEFNMPRLLTTIKDLNEVRSVQRIPLAPGQNAEILAERYIRWLPFYLKPFLRVDLIKNSCEYRVRALNLKLLGLKKDLDISRPDRQLFRITEGALVAESDRGRFEFRESYNKKFLIVALHNFKPALPWAIYRFTQAILHQLVMYHFAKFIRKAY
ncbi:MAG: NAD(P)H-binding protein [Oligoflexales bacterium]|nr:NAD(P)H-binding protein [Oligoflexales bacterium]